MDESAFPAYTMFDTPFDSIMDYDYMDELLLKGCWLQATDGSEFFQDIPSTSSPLFDPSFLWPTLEPSNGDLSKNSLPKDIQEERQRSSFPENLSVGFPTHSEDFLVEWIGPRPNCGPSLSVMERLVQALRNIEDRSKGKNMLIQVWVPVNEGGRTVLSTSDQPFSLNLNCPQLASYRNISENYQFPAEEGSKESAGLPGRVFIGRVPEWTPDVQFFRREEYPRISDAQQCNVRGTLAVPVFNQGSRSCLGVIELVMTTQKSNYIPEFESVCKALEAVDLRGSEVTSTQKVKVSDGSYQAALPEILEVLQFACKTHGLPLAQTWVPCIQQGKEGCRHSDENLVHCISTVESACYVSDPQIKDFHEACAVHHLLRGQGVAGRAFMTNQPCFSPDVTTSTRTEYPLSHHARMFGLCAAVAVRLRSTYAGAADYVLEFFLPLNCKEPEEQKKMLNSLSSIIKKVSRSLRTITEKELQEETIKLVDQVYKIPSDGGVSKLKTPRVEKFCNVVPLLQAEESRKILTEKLLEVSQQQHDSGSNASVAFIGNHSASGKGSLLNEGKKGQKRRPKAEKSVTLQMLRQHFAGSLKDGAKNIGVCPTTLKRICRQHGIKRWPSRKIKKVGHSLKKIQLVMDSVHEASGAFQIKSFYSNFPELGSPNLSKASPPSTSKANSGTFSPQGCGAAAAASISPSSSCSQSLSSSQSSSSGTHPHPDPHSDTLTIIGHEDSGDGVLKRAKVDAELHASSDGGSKLLPTSLGHIFLVELPKCQNRPPKEKSTGGSSREGEVQRVKVTYGEEKVRFRMQNNWGYMDLLQEIARRFSVNDIDGLQLKYLDDDSEWVLLTCDADLEECIDVCRSCESHTIKLSLCDSQHHLGSSLGSNAPL